MQLSWAIILLSLRFSSSRSGTLRLRSWAIILLSLRFRSVAEEVITVAECRVYDLREAQVGICFPKLFDLGQNAVGSFWISHLVCRFGASF
jgi:hypothetical protein